MTGYVGKLLQGGIGFRERILQVLARGFIAHDLRVADENTLLVANRVHKAIGEKLGAVFVAVPADVRRASGLLGYSHLGFTYLDGFILGCEDNRGVLSDPFLFGV